MSNDTIDTLVVSIPHAIANEAIEPLNFLKRPKYQYCLNFTIIDVQ